AEKRYKRAVTMLSLVVAVGCCLVAGAGLAWLVLCAAGSADSVVELRARLDARSARAAALEAELAARRRDLNEIGALKERLAAKRSASWWGRCASRSTR